MDLEQDKILTCEICNEYQGTAAQLRGHKPRCKGPEPIELDPVKLEEHPTERVRTPDRSKRKPFGVPQKRLPNVKDDEKFHYRIINDNWSKDPGRVKRAIDGGYEKVEGYDPMPVGTNEDGSAIRGVLMKIPMEWYKEDQATKQQEVDKIDAAIKKGTIEQQAGDKRYSDIKIHSNYNENG